MVLGARAEEGILSSHLKQRGIPESSSPKERCVCNVEPLNNRQSTMRALSFFIYQTQRDGVHPRA